MNGSVRPIRTPSQKSIFAWDDAINHSTTSVHRFVYRTRKIEKKKNHLFQKWRLRFPGLARDRCVVVAKARTFDSFLEKNSRTMRIISGVSLTRCETRRRTFRRLSEDVLGCEFRILDFRFGRSIPSKKWNGLIEVRWLFHNNRMIILATWFTLQTFARRVWIEFSNFYQRSFGLTKETSTSTSDKLRQISSPNKRLSYVSSACRYTIVRLRTVNSSNSEIFRRMSPRF